MDFILLLLELTPGLAAVLAFEVCLGLALAAEDFTSGFPSCTPVGLVVATVSTAEEA